MCHAVKGEANKTDDDNDDESGEISIVLQKYM